MIYDVGDGVSLRHEVRNPDGALTAATVALTVTKPSGATVVPLVNGSSVGIYDAATFTADEPGSWRYVWTVTGAVTDVTPGTFAVGNPAPALYAALPMLKLALGGVTDATDDVLLNAALASASRQIDAFTGRRFYADPVATPRTYRTTYRTFNDGNGQVLTTDDISSVTGLIVETGYAGSTPGWAAMTEFETVPENALELGRPITGLRTLTLYPWVWDFRGRIRVTARWGWPAVPDVVQQATLIQAARLYKRKESPQGVAGISEWGPIRVSRVDPDVQALVSHLCLPGFA